jgi:nitroimidazol reductase NimA-like FMN-containing flavoprotein (pyridoxamine 5'-phosphate oxidase superfamily)
MHEDMLRLLRAKDIGVLATASENAPHCSLMAYAASEDGGRIYMLTSRSTKKYRNCRRNAHVSLLVDNREDGLPCEETMALTLEGDCRPVSRERCEQLKQEILARHPQLEKLASHPDSDVLEMEVHTAQLLRGATDSRFERLR